MLKQLLGLALLSTLAHGRLTWNDRQLEDGADQGTGDEWQYCEDICESYCPPCNDSYVCAEDEIKCGEGPMQVAPNGFVLHLCARDEICVSNKCSCMYIHILCLYQIEKIYTNGVH